MPKIIDLHIHSNCSDGELTPYQIIDEAKKNNVDTISITDHDTTIAYTPDLIKYAIDNNITLIPAVEMSTRYIGIGIHVLGYNFDITNKQLQDTLSLLKNARLDYLTKVTRKLNDLGYTLDIDTLQQLTTVTKAHISLAVIENKANEELLIQEFGHIPSKGEFIETIMNENCPAYVEKYSITPIEASRIIHEAGGKVIVAHPVVYTYEDNIKSDQVINIIKEMKADGIESNYIYIDSKNILHDDCEFWNNFAINNNLITTIGSDFHNYDGIRPEIGLINTDLRLNDENVNTILINLL